MKTACKCEEQSDTRIHILDVFCDSLANVYLIDNLTVQSQVHLNIYVSESMAVGQSTKVSSGNTKKNEG